MPLDQVLLTDWLLQHLIRFLPVFFRVLSFLAATPIFRRNTPSLVTIGMSSIVALALYPTVTVPPLDFNWHYAWVVIQEIGFGLLMGLVVTTFLYAVYIAGQLMDVPMGFGMVNLLDPQIGMEVPMMAQFHFMLAMLLFLTIDGHHVLLRYLVMSFRAAPVAMIGSFDTAYPAIVEVIGTAFNFGFRIALPIVGVLFLTDVLLGVAVRAVPQINVFFIGFPIKAALGLVVLILGLGGIIYTFYRLFGSDGLLFETLGRVLRMMGGTP